MTVGQVIGSAVGLGMSIGYPAFALLYGTSSVIRVIAWRQAAPEEATSASSMRAAAPQAARGHEKTAEAEATAVV